MFQKSKCFHRNIENTFYEITKQGQNWSRLKKYINTNSKGPHYTKAAPDIFEFSEDLGKRSHNRLKVKVIFTESMKQMISNFHNEIINIWCLSTNPESESICFCFKGREALWLCRNDSLRGWYFWDVDWTFWNLKQNFVKINIIKLLLVSNS